MIILTVDGDVPGLRCEGNLRLVSVTPLHTFCQGNVVFRVNRNVGAFRRRQGIFLAADGNRALWSGYYNIRTSVDTIIPGASDIDTPVFGNKARAAVALNVISIHGDAFCGYINLPSAADHLILGLDG
ncbi:hypothetical protein SDC9_60527 [bioreactor metagenome]|uniref:Uncharacterized protein n=1 Tax=bioreactor metagenome TaxID=1076179 RepID=A0A644XE43_9ZZZZ